MHSENHQYLLTMRLFGLFLKCPFREATADCPFSDVRKLRSLELKFQLAAKMASHPNCQENVCNTHEACYRERMQQVINACHAKSAIPLIQKAQPQLPHPAAVCQQ